MAGEPLIVHFLRITERIAANMEVLASRLTALEERMDRKEEIIAKMQDLGVDMFERMVDYVDSKDYDSRYRTGEDASPRNTCARCGSTSTSSKEHFEKLNRQTAEKKAEPQVPVLVLRLPKPHQTEQSETQNGPKQIESQTEKTSKENEAQSTAEPVEAHIATALLKQRKRSQTETRKSDSETSKTCAARQEQTVTSVHPPIPGCPAWDRQTFRDRDPASLEPMPLSLTILRLIVAFLFLLSFVFVVLIAMSGFPWLRSVLNKLDSGEVYYARIPRTVELLVDLKLESELVDFLVERSMDEPENRVYYAKFYHGLLSEPMLDYEDLHELLLSKCEDVAREAFVDSRFYNSVDSTEDGERVLWPRLLYLQRDEWVRTQKLRAVNFVLFLTALLDEKCIRSSDDRFFTTIRLAIPPRGSNKYNTTEQTEFVEKWLKNPMSFTS
ncbi:hypothetical protein QR680_007686 [Steinernema hermaphroditum]|uniref:Transmembrane protein n=1 Tax=Steinernema hermaphroditum TaxID=289476 RepID=A0AA39M6T0_9BILA|nr:hypothetical protein QR680_007686 [Steinernema hermaphroditum]